MIMRVMLINGSPHEDGSTSVALAEVARTLRECGAETETLHLGAKPIPGCMGCYACFDNGGKCAIDDVVNVFTARAAEFDGFVFGAPVHYAGPNASTTGFMDRAFFSSAAKDRSAALRLKPAAAICVARRGGASASFDRLNKYFTITQMPIISSQYWNMVHGLDAGDVPSDEEGLQTMRTLARNMAWFIRCVQAAREAGVKMPELEEPIATNFIRRQD